MAADRLMGTGWLTYLMNTHDIIIGRRTPYKDVNHNIVSYKIMLLIR